MDNTTEIERIELPGGYFITLEGDYAYLRRADYMHIATLEKYGTQDGHKTARAFAAALQPQGWQPISTAPKDGTRFLFTLTHGFVGIGWYVNGKHFLCDSFGPTGGNHRNTEPQKWQPLPVPPPAPVEGQG